MPIEINADGSATATEQKVEATVAGYTPTDEQAEIIAIAREVEARRVAGTMDVLVLMAGAGAGKTSTLKMLETTLGGRGQYTAFNASLVAESKSKFKRAACNTTHSLAFRAVGKKYAHRLGGARVKSDYIAVALGIQPMQLEVPNLEVGTPHNVTKTKTMNAGLLASYITVALRRFYQSDDRDIEARHFKFIDGIDHPNDRTNNDRVRQYLLPFAKKAWEDVRDVNGKLPFSHDAYVKIWQLDRPIIAADYILLDEAQDTAEVFLDILRQQKHAMLILVGDENQSIYKWRGAVDAMAAFPGAPRRFLSQSFRFGQKIADVANSILAGLSEKTDLVMRGLPSIKSKVEGVARPRCILCRTNAGAIGRVLWAIGEGMRPHLIGGGTEVVEFVRAVQSLQAGRGTRHPELACFDSWREVQEYVKTDEGEDLKLMVKLIEEFGVETILGALENMPEEKDADVTISTAHKSKGREWDTVKLGCDFPTESKMGDDDRRLLYVACTRAKLILDIEECPSFSPEDGVRIVYTNAGDAIDDEVEQIVESAVSPPQDVEETVVETPLAAPAPARRSEQDEEFTWASHGGGWGVRGPEGFEDKMVTVTRRNGTTSRVRLGKVVKEYPDAVIYLVG